MNIVLVFSWESTSFYNLVSEERILTYFRTPTFWHLPDFPLKALILTQSVTHL